MSYNPCKITGWYAERNTKIVQAYREGHNIKQIAKDVQLDVETVRMILRGYGLTTTRGRW